MVETKLLGCVDVWLRVLVGGAFWGCGCGNGHVA